MAKYYLSTPLKVDAVGYQGKIALIHKRKGVWNIVLVKGNKVKYLKVIHEKDFPLDVQKLKALVEEPLRKRFNDFWLYTDLEVELMYCKWHDRGIPSSFQVIENIWVRRSRKRGTYYLCVCRGYAILKSFYIPRAEAYYLYQLTKQPIMSFLLKHLKERYGIEPTWQTNERPSREDWGIAEEIQSKVEDYGDEALEDYWENGDLEALRDYYGDPDTAREAGLTEEEIEEIFGED